MKVSQNEKKAITATFLKNHLQVKEVLFRVYDTAIHGFVLRVQPSGTMTFYFEYRNKAGANKSFKIGRLGNITLAQAREIAGNKSAEVQLGIDIQATKKKEQVEAKTNEYNTLSGFLDERYEKWALAHLVTGKQSELLSST